MPKAIAWAIWSSGEPEATVIESSPREGRQIRSVAGGFSLNETRQEEELCEDTAPAVPPHRVSKVGRRHQGGALGCCVSTTLESSRVCAAILWQDPLVAVLRRPLCKVEISAANPIPAARLRDSVKVQVSPWSEPASATSSPL